MIWERDWSVKGQPRLTEFTDQGGRAKFNFSADTRLKAAICGAFRGAYYSDGGYAFRATHILNPFKGGHFGLPIELEPLRGRDQDTIPWAPADSAREALEINVAGAP